MGSPMQEAGGSPIYQQRQKLTSSREIHSAHPGPRQTGLRKKYLGKYSNSSYIGCMGPGNSRTPWVEHALDNRAHHGGVSQHHKLEAVTRDKGDILAGSLRRRHAGLIEGCSGKDGG